MREYCGFRVLEALRTRIGFRYLDSTLIAMIMISSVLFTVFLVLPLLDMISLPIMFTIERVASDVKTGYSLIELFTDPRLFRTYSTTQPLMIAQLGNVTWINFRGWNFGVIPNTLIIASLVTVFTTVFGLVVAFIMARYSFRGKLLMRVVAYIPLLMTPFVNAYIIRKLFSFDGFFTYLLNTVLSLPLKINVDGMFGVVLTQSMAFWPIVYLNIYSSMMMIDPSLEEQAENLGAKGFRLFRTVTFPLSLPGLAAGAAVVFIFSMEDLGGPIAYSFYDVLSYSIYSNIKAAQNIGEVGAYVGALSLILLTLALAIFFSIKKYVSLKQYAMLSRGGRWVPRLRKPGLLCLIIYLVILPLMIFTATPQIGVFIIAFSERWSRAYPEGFTLSHFTEVATNPDILSGLTNSIKYATVATLIIVVLSLSAAYLAARSRTHVLSDLLDMLSTSPLAIPGLAIASGYIIMFTSWPFKDTSLDPLSSYGPWMLVVLAYVIRRSPFATRTIYAGLQQMHVTYEEAAMNLGASRVRTLATIVIPLIGLNVLSGALLAFVYSVAETSVSVTIGAIAAGQKPLTAVILDYLTGGRAIGLQLAAAMAVLIVLTQLLIIAVTNVFLKQRYAFIGV
ncbi:MAG: iron ABC transporter permease [Zestosphaera sp.]